MELNDAIYNAILEKCDKGNQLADAGKFKEALCEFNDALKMLPDPVYIWEAATWLFVSIGDMYFQLEEYENSIEMFMQSQKCPDGLGNPFVCVRVGECFFELGNIDKAKEYLLQAYMLEGNEIFADADPKYFKVIAPLI
jgi:tetratricopeptide (TPR) repeat protein